MKKFENAEKFTITGKGDIFACKEVKEQDTPNVGEQVEINGTVYEVRGIEMFRKMIPGATNNIGILVKKVGNIK